MEQLHWPFLRSLMYTISSLFRLQLGVPRSRYGSIKLV
jgi:uncharacterized MAPEG superfamily protein